MPTIRFKTFDLLSHNFQDLNDAYRYWNEKKVQSGGIAPSWTDVNLLDLRSELLPKVCVVDVSGDLPDFTYRYWGTALTDMHHYDLSGKSVRNLTPAEYGECVWGQYNEVYTSRTPQTFLTEVPLESGFFVFYVAVRMPLSSDGERIDKIFVAEDYGQTRDELKTLFNTLA